MQDLSLTVTIVDTSNMHVVARTETKRSGSSWIENEKTWFTCKNTNRTTYRGLARGVSLEDGKIYEQLEGWAGGPVGPRLLIMVRKYGLEDRTLETRRVRIVAEQA